MNYYAKGGQAHGLSTLDSHSVTYKDGVPAYGLGGWIQKNIVQPVVKPAVQAVKTVQNLPGINVLSDAATQAVKPIDQALVGLDKSVGKMIPGGWGTVAAVAASMIPGGQFAALGLSKAAALGGLGALTGSGVMHKGGSFNLQGAIAGGALAYGAASLASGLEGAAEGASKTGAAAVEEAGKSTLTQGLQSGSGSALTGTSSGYVPSEFLSGTSIGAGASQGASALTPTANALANAGSDFIAPAITSGGTATTLGNLGTAVGPAEYSLSAALPEAGTSSLSGYGLGNIATPPSMLDTIASKASGAYDALTTPSNYESFGKDYAANVSKIGSGIKDLVTGAPGASAGFNATGATLSNTAMPIIAGTMGLEAVQAQRDYLDQQKQSGAISDADYQTQVAEIERQAEIARESVAGSPFSTTPDRAYETQPTLYGTPESSSTLYANNPSTSGSTLYARGGAVDNEMGFDDSPRGLGLGNMSNGFMNGGSTPTFAKGGQAKEKRDYLDMLDAELRMAPAQYVEGMGFVTPPPSVGGRLGANFDALGGNIRAGLSGNAMMTQDKKILARPEMVDVGYKGQVGPGELDVGLQRALQSMPGRPKDYAINAKYSMNFADGGNVPNEPRFLSGGGDGMSDDIPANIGGKQEARLADGEFVVPADVVSHLGNGSSKAGAKQLYSMMDKVRHARTGNKKQGKKINPSKFLAA